VTKANAHPFREGHLTLVHNGTIREGLNVEDHNVEVDSHALCKSIADKGLKEAMSELQGAWAIILHDSKKGVVQILRNHERELHYCRWGSTILIMSEREGLEYLCNRNKLHNEEVLSFKANTLYSFDLEEKKMVEGEIVEGRQFPKFVGYTGTTNHSSSPSGTGGGCKTVYPTNPGPVVTTHVIHRDYNAGENIEFEVSSKLIVNDNVHFKGYDDKGNEVRFTTSNLKAAATISKGDRGVGQVVSVGMDFALKTATYTVRFREIVWDVVAPVGTDLVVTYGGETFTRAEWEALCIAQQCWSCQGALDQNNPEETVVVRQGGMFRPYCADCVSEQSASCLNSNDKATIANAFSRYH
jgi:hypothetical protein